MLDQTGAAQAKKRLREEMTLRSRAMSGQAVLASDAGIRRGVLKSSLYQNAETVFIYVSVGREPDTRALIRHALAAGKRVYVPRCLEKPRMQAVRIEKMEDLRPGVLGIPEPANGEVWPAGRAFDLIVVPCVSASETGRRLGHGAGYYDAFLSSHGGATLCLCREEAMCEEIPMTEKDRWMDFIATERGLRAAAHP